MAVFGTNRSASGGTIFLKAMWIWFCVAPVLVTRVTSPLMSFTYTDDTLVSIRAWRSTAFQSRGSPGFADFTLAI